VCNGNEVPLVAGEFNQLAVDYPNGIQHIGLDMWAGINPETGCLYWGSDELNVCKTDCFYPPVPTAAELEQMYKQDIKNALPDPDGILDLAGYVIDAIIIGGAVTIIMIILSIIFGAMGTAG